MLIIFLLVISSSVIVSKLLCVIVIVYVVPSLLSTLLPNAVKIALYKFASLKVILTVSSVAIDSIGNSTLNVNINSIIKLFIFNIFFI